MDRGYGPSRTPVPTRKACSRRVDARCGFAQTVGRGLAPAVVRSWISGDLFRLCRKGGLPLQGRHIIRLYSNKSLSPRERWRRSRRRGCIHLPPCGRSKVPLLLLLPHHTALVILVCVLRQRPLLFAPFFRPRRRSQTSPYGFVHSRHAAARYGYIVGALSERPFSPHDGSGIRTCPPSRQAERSRSLQGKRVQGASPYDAASHKPVGRGLAPAALWVVDFGRSRIAPTGLRVQSTPPHDTAIL